MITAYSNAMMESNLTESAIGGRAANGNFVPHGGRSPVSNQRSVLFTKQSQRSLAYRAVLEGRLKRRETEVNWLKCAKPRVIRKWL